MLFASISMSKSLSSLKTVSSMILGVRCELYQAALEDALNYWRDERPSAAAPARPSNGRNTNMVFGSVKCRIKIFCLV